MRLPRTFVPVEKEPVVVKKVEPKYPDLAMRAGLEGKVWVKIWVDKEGKAKQVVILKSDAEIFNEPAMEAAKQFRVHSRLHEQRAGLRLGVGSVSSSSSRTRNNTAPAGLVPLLRRGNGSPLGWRTAVCVGKEKRPSPHGSLDVVMQGEGITRKLTGGVCGRRESIRPGPNCSTGPSGSRFSSSPPASWRRASPS